MTDLLLLPFCLTVSAFLGLWLVSLPIRNVTVVDGYWGPGFAVCAWAAGAAAGFESWRGLLVSVLVTLWGIRLGYHLGLRAWREGHEDKRYAAMRKRRGPRFWLWSLFLVFGIQALILWIVALPLQLVWLSPGGPVSGLDAAGIVLALTGFLLEARADWELAKFRRDPRTAGQVLQSGVWAWSRHPNYFGDACLWWGLGLVGLAGGAPLWSLGGPLLMTFLLLRVSGVPLLEKELVHTRPAYAAYQARTSAFVPWPPKRPTAHPIRPDGN